MPPGGLSPPGWFGCGRYGYRPGRARSRIRSRVVPSCPQMAGIRSDLQLKPLTDTASKRRRFLRLADLRKRWLPVGRPRVPMSTTHVNSTGRRVEAICGHRRAVRTALIPIGDGPHSLKPSPAGSGAGARPGPGPPTGGGPRIPARHCGGVADRRAGAHLCSGHCRLGPTGV